AGERVELAAGLFQLRLRIAGPLGERGARERERVLGLLARDRSRAALGLARLFGEPVALRLLAPAARPLALVVDPGERSRSGFAGALGLAERLAARPLALDQRATRSFEPLLRFAQRLFQPVGLGRRRAPLGPLAQDPFALAMRTFHPRQERFVALTRAERAHLGLGHREVGFELLVLGAPHLELGRLARAERSCERVGP